MLRVSNARTLQLEGSFRAIATLAIAAIVLTAACTAGGTPTPSSTEVTITLTEFGIQASETTFQAGTQYQFIVRNEGAIPHELMVMPQGVMDHMQALMEIEEHDLPPGSMVMQSFTFEHAREYEFACHLAGHYDAGMKIGVRVQ